MTTEPTQPMRSPQQGYQPGYRPGYEAGQPGYTEPTQPMYPSQPGYQPGHQPGYEADRPGYQPGYRPGAGPGAQPGMRPRATRRRRGRRWTVTIFVLIVVLIVLVIGDRVANAVAENMIANKIESSGFPATPSVTIEGFPFLTQVLAHDIHQIDISASNVPAGPVNITSVKATATGVHLNSSFNGATVDQINGTVFIAFSSLASAGNGGTGAGISLSADGSNEVKISAGIGPLSDTEVAKVSLTGSNQVSVQVLNGGSPLSSVLSSFGSFSFTLPKLPAGLQVKGVAVTSQGLQVSAAAQHTTLSE
jgi:hypothetical protein